jgi:hypothetical protein
LYKEFRGKIDETDGRLTNLQRAEDEYYITAIYLLELANRAYDLFKSSEIEERRQLLKLTLQDLVLDGKKIRFQVQKPFDSILNFADGPSWLPTSKIIIEAINKILAAFQDTLQAESVKVRWEEIKKLSGQIALSPTQALL